MYSLPKSIEIGDKQYNIRNKGDYRVVLDVINALNDTDLDEEERVISSLIIFYEDLTSVEDVYINRDREELIKKMYLFINCNQEDVGLKVNYKIIDWNKDEQLIVSAINNVSGKEVRELEYLHWWTFMGYYLTIGEGTFSTVVSIRHKIATHKKLEKYEREFKNSNPQYFNIDYRSSGEKDLEQEFLESIWNKS